MFRFLIVLGLLVPSFGHSRECNQDIDRLATEYEIKIICKEQSVIDSSTEITFKEANDEMINNSSNPVRLFLLRYDKSFIKEKIKSLNLFNRIIFRGSRAGGFHHSGHVWLTIGNYPEEKIPIIYQEILHHEFSSIIYKQPSLFDKTLIWKKISPGYEYSLQFLKKCLDNINFGNASNDEILYKGYLLNYSTTDDENDFNVYAEHVFMHPDLLKIYYQKYPLVAKKARLFKQMYRDAGFKGKFPDET